MIKIENDVILKKYKSKVHEDALFEYETTEFKNFDVNKKENGGVVVKVDVKENNIYHKLLITLKNDGSDFTSFCDCGETNCIHVLLGILKYNEYVEKQSKSFKQKESDSFKLKLLEKVYLTEQKNKLIFIKVRISKIKDGEIKLSLKSGIVSENEYVVSDLHKFIEDIHLKKPLKFGQNIIVEDYELEYNSLKIFNELRSLSLKLQALKIKPEKTYFKIDEIEQLLKIVVNNEIIYDNLEYIVKDKLNDITLNVSTLSDGYEITLHNSSNYYKVSNEIVVNHQKHYLYTLNKNQISKMELIESFLGTEKKIQIDNEHKEHFINEMLPRLYNEFNIVLDFENDITIIEDSINVSLFCYLENKIIHINPKFMYGDYNANEENMGILIRRNTNVENQIINLLLDNGFVYDYYKKLFVIQAERKQFIFLTKTLYDLRQEVEVYLDEKLEKALKNLNSNSISVSIINTGNDYFELNFDLDGLELSDVEQIINSYNSKKEFHLLENGQFITLTDEYLIEQLSFIKQLADETNSNFRVPKYKAIYLKHNIDGLFNKASYEKEFNEYIDYIMNIEEIDYKKVKSENVELREYQKHGVNFINNLYRANLGGLLSDEMGLGKTIQTIMFIKYNNINNALIVMPKALLYNWENEFKKYAPEIEVELVYKEKNQREKQIKSNATNKIILTSYNVLNNDIELYEKYNFDAVIIDEAQYIKNPLSKTSISVKKLKANFFLALTGTPIENNLTELWSIFEFILPSYLGEIKTFKNKYILKNEKLNEIVSPFILRRLKKDVLKELPNKIENDILCELEEEQQKLYISYAKSQMEEVNHYLNMKNLGQKHMQVLNAITRLRQLAIDPKLFINEYENESGKLSVFTELVTEIIESKQKVIVFSQFTTMLGILKNKLDSLNIKYYYLDGNTKPQQRMMDVERFNKNSVPVYLISLKAGGVGLNLTSASNVIIYDPWWNPAVENQAIDRTHRIGQVNNVNVYRLISKNTLEEKIMNIKSDKLKLLNDTIDNEESFISKLDNETLIDLLQIKESD